MRWYSVIGNGLEVTDLPALRRQFAQALDNPELRTALREVFPGNPAAVEDRIKQLIGALDGVIQGIAG